MSCTSGPPSGRWRRERDPAAAARRPRKRLRAGGALLQGLLGAPVAEEYASNGGAHVTILDVGRATLELSNDAQVELIDRVEVARRAVPHLRVALGVDDCEASAGDAVAGGAEQIAPPTHTPWDSLNSRLHAPGGIQLTLFQELGQSHG